MKLLERSYTLREQFILLVTVLLCVGSPAAAASKEQPIHGFTGGRDGRFPFAAVIRDKAANLYGTTDRGGRFDNGTVFKLAVPTTGSKGAWTETVLYSFANAGDGIFSRCEPCL